MPKKSVFYFVWSNILDNFGSKSNDCEGTNKVSKFII